MYTKWTVKYVLLVACH